MFQRRLANAAKKAIAKIPQRSVKFGDKVSQKGTHWKCLNEVLLMSINSICFYREIEKINPGFSKPP